MDDVYDHDGWDYGTLAVLLVYFFIWLSADTYFVSRRLYMWILGFNFCGGTSPSSFGPQTSQIIRDCELALRKFWQETGWTEVFAKEGASVDLVGCSMPVFRTMSYIQIYQIRTQVLCWKDESLYLEQVVSRTGDPDKVFAICLARYRVDGALPHDVIHGLSTGGEIGDQCRAELDHILQASMSFPQPP